LQYKYITALQKTDEKSYQKKNPRNAGLFIIWRRERNPPARSRLRFHAATIARMEEQEKERIAMLEARAAAREQNRVERCARVKARMETETNMWEQIRKGNYPWED
jgi:hypothetical protein